MMDDDQVVSSFEAFKNSFSYGSRNDLNFKFLKALSDQEAARFFQELLWKLGDALDDGDFTRVVDHAYEWQVRAYSGGEAKWSYDDGPFTALRRPLSQSRLTFLTSSGHFFERDDPQPFEVAGMTQEEATERIVEFLRSEPQLSAIPTTASREELRVRHPGYDVRGARLDPNVVFPLERLRELEEEGVIGELAPEAYSFVGACSQRRLLGQTGPQWVETIRKQAVDGVLMVPV
jgi:D-proline reductase (dithiol) PrdB